MQVILLNHKSRNVSAEMLEAQSWPWKCKARQLGRDDLLGAQRQKRPCRKGLRPWLQVSFLLIGACVLGIAASAFKHMLTQMNHKFLQELLLDNFHATFCFSLLLCCNACPDCQ